jgi:hypothetical protein
MGRLLCMCFVNELYYNAPEVNPAKEHVDRAITHLYHKGQLVRFFGDRNNVQVSFQNFRS